MTTTISSMATPLGLLTLTTDGEALTGAWFGDPQSLFDRLRLDAPPRVGPDLGELTEAVTAYFEGEIDAIDALPVRQPGSEFQRRCWDAMRDVPAGETISYTTLAERAGSPGAVRAAGCACGRNLVAVVVPCHRIVTSGGGLGGYAHGLTTKTWLLDHEGAPTLTGSHR